MGCTDYLCSLASFTLRLVTVLFHVIAKIVIPLSSDVLLSHPVLAPDSPVLNRDLFDCFELVEEEKEIVAD